MLRRLCFFTFVFLHIALYMWQIEAARHIEGVTFLMQLHNDSMNGTVGTPYLYRVLVPYLLSPLINGTPGSYVIAYLVGDTVASWLMLLLMFQWFRVFASETYAMMGVLLIALTLPLMMRWWFWSVSTPVEVCLWLVGLLLLKRIWDLRLSLSSPRSTETVASS